MLSVLHAPVRRCVLVLGGAPPSVKAGWRVVWDAQVGSDELRAASGHGHDRERRLQQRRGERAVGVTLPLAAGTYYWRVVPQGAGSTTVEQTVTLT